MTTVSDKTVSIITPGYNAARFVADAIESVRRQTYEKWEMLVIDDCSRDETRDVVRAFSRRDSRVKLIEQPANGGPARARQAGLDAAGGRYIAFLDSDDCWLPRKLERQLEYMHANEAAISFTQFRRISADGLRSGKLIPIPERLGYRQLLCNTAIATSTVIVDREKTGPFSMTVTYYDDFVLWLSILRRGFVAHGLQEDLMRYRVASGSWSRNKLRSALWVWRTYQQIEKLSVPYSAWCFAAYVWNAVSKYRSF
jgi:teichuronic acid biosynthesis glycosyltransferase TuaG